MPQYRVGTVSVVNGSSTVTGTGTAWLANADVGHWFMIRDEGITYTVAGVLSDTQLVLNGAYQGTSKSGAYYWITRDFTPRGYAVPGPGDIDATTIFRRTIYEIDADLTAALGSADGSTTSIKVKDIVDVNSTTALAGEVLTKLQDGTFGFTSPGILSIAFANVGDDAAGAGVYSGSTGSTHNFRRIKGAGATSVVQNANDITISSPAPGETNTLGHQGSATSVSLVGTKNGTILGVAGVRAGSGATVVREGNDIVISAASSGTGTGEITVAENLGSSTTNTVRVYSDKVANSLRFKSTFFQTERFTVTESNGVYTVNLIPLKLADASDVNIATATVGQVLTKQTDNTWRGASLPAPGIANLQADTNPTLGGNLALSGKRIIGAPNDRSGYIERPKNKTYTLILRCSAPINITEFSHRLAVGSLKWRIDIGGIPESSPDGSPVSPLSGETAASSVTATTVPADFVPASSGDEVILTLFEVSATAEDFAFSLSYVSA